MAAPDSRDPQRPDAARPVIRDHPEPEDAREDPATPADEPFAEPDRISWRLVAIGIAVVLVVILIALLVL